MREKNVCLGVPYLLYNSNNFYIQWIPVNRDTSRLSTLSQLSGCLNYPKPILCILVICYLRFVPIKQLSQLINQSINHLSINHLFVTLDTVKHNTRGGPFQGYD